MTTLLLSLLLVVALVLAAFCAGAETGFLSLSRGRVLHMARAGSRKAKRLQKALSDMSRTTTTLLIGNNIAAVTYSACSAALIDRGFSGSAVAHTVFSLLAATIMLYAGEFLPKLFYSARPLRRMLVLSGAYRTLSTVLTPLVAPLCAVLSRLLPRRASSAAFAADDILRILKDRKDGVKLTDFESALIARIIVLRAKGGKVTPETLLSVLDEE